MKKKEVKTMVKEISWQTILAEIDDFPDYGFIIPKEFVCVQKGKYAIYKTYPLRLLKTRGEKGNIQIKKGKEWLSINDVYDEDKVAYIILDLETLTFINKVFAELNTVFFYLDEKEG